MKETTETKPKSIRLEPPIAKLIKELATEDKRSVPKELEFLILEETKRRNKGK